MARKMLGVAVAVIDQQRRLLLPDVLVGPKTGFTTVLMSLVPE